MDALWDLFKPKILKIGFEDVIHAIKHPDLYHIINTLNITDQECLIYSTIPYQLEEKLVNEMISSYDTRTKSVIVYGKNAQDDTVDKKYKQLVTLGIDHVYLYSGGLFEWVLLQDIYGSTQFPTTRLPVDILKYKPVSLIIHPRLGF